MSEVLSPLKSKSNPIFSYDLLYTIFEFLQNDFSSLFRCCLVSWEANEAALKFLYREVELYASYNTFLDHRRGGPFEPEKRLKNAIVSRNCHHVRVFRLRVFFLSGYVEEEKRKIVSLISTCIRAFSNLRTMALLPFEAFRPEQDETYIILLQHLAQSQSVRQLEIKDVLKPHEEEILLPWVRRLQTLTLHDPVTCTVNRLFKPVDREMEGLFEDMTGLHLEGVCTNITPDILRSIAIHLKNIRWLTLDYLPPSSHAVLLDFLGQMPSLYSLSLRHDSESEYPTKKITLPNLRSFTLTHTAVKTRADIEALCKWINSVIASSPLEHLCLIVERSYEWKSRPGVNHDILINHIRKKHAKRLKSLQMKDNFIGKTTLRALCTELPHLEELQLSTSKSGVSTFMQCLKRMTRLHTVIFNVQNAKPSTRDLTLEEITAMFKNPPALTTLTVNETEWKVCWDTGALVETPIEDSRYKL